MRPIRAAVGAAWETAARRPSPTLARYLRRLEGYDERTREPLRRPELPGPRVVVIVETGPPLRVFAPGAARPKRHAGGFVAGLHDAPTLTEHDGWQRGVQINLTPAGARRLFGLPRASSPT